MIVATASVVVVVVVVVLLVQAVEARRNLILMTINHLLVVIDATRYPRGVQKVNGPLLTKPNQLCTISLMCLEVNDLLHICANERRRGLELERRPPSTMMMPTTK